MQIRRQTNPRLNTRDGPSRIITPNRNIIIHPRPQKGGMEVRYMELDVSASFSQSPGTRPWSANYFFPMVDHFSPWTDIVEGKCLGVDTFKYQLYAYLLSPIVTASSNDAVTGLVNPCDNIYWVARGQLWLELQDHLGRTIPQWTGTYLYQHQVDGAGSGGTTAGVTSEYSFGNISFLSNIEKPAFPTKYRWCCKLMGNSYIIMTGKLMLQYFYYGG